MEHTLEKYYLSYSDNSYIRQLDVDTESEKNYPNNKSRSVTSGHYVLSKPTPLKDPVLISFSKDLSKTLSFSQTLMQSEKMLRYLSGVSQYPTWVTPYALSINGTEMIDNCPYKNDTGYGDGRAHSVGEFIVDGGRWELQLKGSGTTPFSRSGDGRAVLRSSVREYLASEAMYHLQVPTTRALSLVVSLSETADRDWYDQSSGKSIIKPNPVAIVCRASSSFIRVGHLELFSRRANNSPEAMTELKRMFWHVVFREYPLYLGLELEDAIREVLKDYAMKIVYMITNWIRVGFVQSNFNSDNCLVSGKTMDYGPFGFLEKYDPNKNFWIGGGQHFSFMNQMDAGKANYLTFAKSLEPLLNRKCIGLHKLANEFNKVAREMMNNMWASKLGLDDNYETNVLLRSLLKLMENDDVDYTIFWRQLTDVPLMINDKMEVVIKHLSKAFFSGVVGNNWKTWLNDYIKLLRIENKNPVKVSIAMKKVSPKYIPREWMLAKAYTDAERNSFETIYELERLFRNPYSEQTDMENKYYVLSPLHVITNKPGISSMSCSS
ncbi:hypothetical protein YASMINEVIRUS_1593 [Yasminevirus sp. GU-2018]|uniref:Selenoprotein O n=1 Tax=Yasminevirus sp. GU-2018 TaxID=2420051 RepID=A0A5K0UBD3_9VIRU|nr:hypothetical protein YASMINEVIRUS_1593 [Yasminevirus sp. GU-2018]